MADSVVAAKAGQKTPEGYYNVERMLKRVLAGNGKAASSRPRASMQVPHRSLRAPKHDGRTRSGDRRGR
jgi:hypothetical protein